MKRISQIIKTGGFIPLLLLFLLTVVKSNAQQAWLLNYTQNTVLDDRQKHFAEAWTKIDWVGKYYFVSIKPQQFQGNLLNINLPGNINLSVDKRELEQHVNGSFSWKGTFRNPEGNADFVVNNDMITARISSTNFVYLIYPLSNGMHILLECNGSRMPQDESIEGYQEMIKQGLKSEMNFEQNKNRIDPETGQLAKIASGACKVRILVAYTATTHANMADPISFCQSCIDATNTAYDNSSVYFHCEMAVAIEEVYTESLNSSTDKVRFHDVSDGYMDDVHDYRTYFDADMCILITENLQSGICGEAYTVANSTYTDPFCVVTRGCAVGNLSFPHELAHLYGCRHDTYVDGTSTPYSYGHGYVYFAGSWRTVMAYNNYCSDNGSSCTRIQYFSNPAISYSGNATGTVSTNDNESALEASVPNISSLEATIADKIFVSSYYFSGGEFSDVIASNSINNSTNNFYFYSGSSGSWRTGVYADLKPGFWAMEGSTFGAYIDQCNALRIAPDYEHQNQTPPLTYNSENINVYPNPFTNQFDLTLNLIQQGKVKMQLFNSLGEKVKDLFSENLSIAGPYKFTFEGTDLSPGIYMIVVSTQTGTMTARLTKSQ